MWLPLGHPPTPQFDYCLSYNDGHPVLQVISHVRTYSVVIGTNNMKAMYIYISKLSR